MKKTFLILVVFTAITVNSFAQRVFDYLDESLSNILILSTAAQLENFDYDGSNALLGTFLEAGQSITMADNFTAGVQYLMLAISNNLNADVDLKVYQGRGTSGAVIAKDTRPDCYCVVRFTPTTSGYHTYELINSSRTTVFISLVRLRAQRNPDFNLDSILDALYVTLGLSQQIAQILPPTAKIPANKWTLFGGNVARGKTTGYFNSTLPRGAYMIVAAGDRTVNNLDVEVVEQSAYDQQDGRLVSINTKTSLPADYGLFSAEASKYYNLKVINKSSRNSSGFMFGFMIQLE